MALLNRVKCALGAATAEGATTFTVGAAAPGYRTPAASGAQNGTTYSVVVEEGSAWFAFLGTYNSSTSSFVVNQVVGGSIGSTAPAFTATATVYCSLFAADIPVPASYSEVRDGTNTGSIVTPKGLNDASAWVNLPSGSAFAPDFKVGVNFIAGLNQNATLSAPANMNAKAGQSGAILFVQDGNGNRTLSYSSAWKFPGGNIPSLSTAPNAVDMLTYICEGTKVYCNLLKGFA